MVANGQFCFVVIFVQIVSFMIDILFFIQYFLFACVCNAVQRKLKYHSDTAAPAQERGQWQDT